MINTLKGLIFSKNDQLLMLLKVLQTPCVMKTMIKQSAENFELQSLLKHVIIPAGLHSGQTVVEVSDLRFIFQRKLRVDRTLVLFLCSSVIFLCSSCGNFNETLTVKLSFKQR